MTPRPTRIRYALVSFALDALLLAGAFLALPLAWEADDPTRTAPLLALGALLGLFLTGGYRLAVPLSPALARLASLGLVGGLGLTWLTLKLVSQKGALLAWNPPALEGFAPTALGLALAAFAHRALHVRWLARHEALAPVALVAEADVAHTLVARWRARGWQAPVSPLTPAAFADLPLTADPLARAHALVLAVPLQALGRAQLERLAAARATGLPVLTAARFEEALFGYTPLDTPDDPWLLFDDALERRTILYLGIKRVLDVLAALVIAALALAPFLVIVLALRLATRGPIFYRQTRAGLNNRPFTLWKLRTMVPDAEAASGPAFAAERDPRVTRAGRFLRRSRIDELPQLWNILVGDMSLVGPRPERPELDRELAPHIPFYALRHLARPGLTGWAQVRMGYGASPSDAFRKLEHDVYYLKHASLWFDLVIVVRTIPVVLRLRGR